MQEARRDPAIDGVAAAWPEGFRYIPRFVDEAEAGALLEDIRRLQFEAVVMRGMAARRRVAHFGWRYGYESWRIEPGPPIPDFLEPLRSRAATLVGGRAADLVEVLVTEYPAGAGIGWHRDAPMFGDVVGVSLLGPARLRFQRGKEGTRQTREVLLESRSAYLLSGAARWAWQHSIPPGKTLRYSITFRGLID